MIEISAEELKVLFDKWLSEKSPLMVLFHDTNKTWCVVSLRQVQLVEAKHLGAVFASKDSCRVTISFMGGSFSYSESSEIPPEDPHPDGAKFDALIFGRLPTGFDVLVFELKRLGEQS